EHKTYLQAIPYFDRLDYVAPMNQEHAFCLAAERLLGLEVPRRAKLIRVLYCEIGRLLSHLLNVTPQALAVAALTPPLPHGPVSGNARQKAMTIRSAVQALTLAALAVLGAAALPAHAQEVQTGTILVCDTQKQAERIVMLFDGDVQAAIS